MSLADQISATAQAGPGWQECSVSWALRVLPPADAAALRQVLSAPTPPRDLPPSLSDHERPHSLRRVGAFFALRASHSVEAPGMTA